MPLVLGFRKEPAHRCRPFLAEVQGKVVHVEVDMALHHPVVHLLAVLPAVVQYFLTCVHWHNAGFPGSRSRRQQQVRAERAPAEDAAQRDREGRNALPTTRRGRAVFRACRADR